MIHADADAYHRRDAQAMVCLVGVATRLRTGYNMPILYVI